MEAELCDNEIRAAMSADDANRAVTLLLAHYGSELLGYLCATMPNRERARDAFALLAEDLWKGLPGFGFRCSARTWAYALARNCRARCLEQDRRNLARSRELEGLPWLRAIVEQTESRTPLHLRSELKVRMRELRARLSEEEQTLLILRVDRGMSWSDLATVLEGEPPDAPNRARAAARMRQRFQALKDKLRTLAIEARLFET